MARCVDEEHYKALVSAAQDAIAALDPADSPTVEEKRFVVEKISKALTDLGERIWRY